MNGKKVELGDRVEEAITGFVGIAVARTEWLFGCVRITVQPEKLKDNKIGETQTFDEPQLKLIKRSIVKHRPVPEEPRSYGPRDDAKALRR